MNGTAAPRARSGSPAPSCAAPGVTRAVLGELKQARRKMIAFSHRIRSLNGRRSIHGDTGPKLAAAGDDISKDLKTLRDSLHPARKQKVRLASP